MWLRAAKICNCSGAREHLYAHEKVPNASVNVGANPTRCTKPSQNLKKGWLK